MKLPVSVWRHKADAVKDCVAAGDYVVRYDIARPYVMVRPKARSRRLLKAGTEE